MHDRHFTTAGITDGRGYEQRIIMHAELSPTCTCTMHIQGLGASLLDGQGPNTWCG